MLDCEWCLLGWFLLQRVRILGEICECQKRQNFLFNWIVKRVKPRNLVENCQNSTHLQFIIVILLKKWTFAWKNSENLCLVSKMTLRNILTSPALQKICSANEIRVYLKGKFWFKKRLALRLAGLPLSGVPALNLI